jgi:hypothetical protein
MHSDCMQHLATGMGPGEPGEEDRGLPGEAGGGLGLLQSLLLPRRPGEQGSGLLTATGEAASLLRRSPACSSSGPNPELLLLDPELLLLDPELLDEEGEGGAGLLLSGVRQPRWVAGEGVALFVSVGLPWLLRPGEATSLLLLRRPGVTCREGEEGRAGDEGAGLAGWETAGLPTAHTLGLAGSVLWLRQPGISSLGATLTNIAVI